MWDRRVRDRSLIKSFVSCLAEYLLRQEIRGYFRGYEVMRVMRVISEGGRVIKGCDLEVIKRVVYR